jgi:hypothetical protein
MISALLVAWCFSRLSALAAEHNVALLDALVRKGLVTEAEAKRVRTEPGATRKTAAIKNTPPSIPDHKRKISEASKRVRLFHDLCCPNETRYRTNPYHILQTDLNWRL